MRRLLLMYQHFGPYHAARWRQLRATLPAAGFEPLGLQLFAKPDLYEWSPGTALQGAPANGTAPDGVTDLGLRTASHDRLRWVDARRLWRALASARPDVVLINGWRTRDAWCSHAWCRQRDVARVIVADSLPAQGTAGKIRDRAKRAIIAGVGSAFVAGAPQRRYLEVLGVDPASIRQGCDAIDNAHFSRARALRSVGGRRLLTVARFSAEKNLPAAGRAFLQFVARRPQEDWSWQIVGYGPDEPALRELAAASGGRIQLRGRRGYEQLPDIYAQADLYWQPSLRDTWALSVNEAMASGLPVLVSSRCGCSEDLVTAATGWSFEPRDQAALCAALQRAADAQADWPRMGEAASAHVAGWGLEAFARGVAEVAALALTRHAA